MHDFSLALHPALHAEHAGTEKQRPVLFEHFLPDHDIGDAGLVLHGDKHDALGRTRALAHQDQTGRRPSLACIASVQVTTRGRESSCRRKLTG